MQHIVPAILTDNPRTLLEQVRIATSFAERVHIDFMDGTFTTRTTVPLDEILALPRPERCEVHIMAHNPLPIAKAVDERGFATSLVHSETVTDPAGLMRCVTEGRTPVGLVLSTQTPLDDIATFDNLVQHLVVMGVRPGAQGQTLDRQTLGRIERLAQHLSHVLLDVDGGVQLETIRPLFAAGVDRAICGSAIWQSAHPENAYHELERLALLGERDRLEKQSQVVPSS